MLVPLPNLPPIVLQDLRSPEQSGYPVCAAAWRLGVHAGVPHRSSLPRRPRPAHLWRQQRDHEGAHRSPHRV